MHAVMMIFLFVMPMTTGLANYIVPLQLGAADMSFPRINALSFWMLVAGAILIVAGLFGLGFCIRTGYAIKREKPDPAEIRARLNRLLAINLGSVALAALGLAMLVAGLML